MDGSLKGLKTDAPTDARQVRSRKALNAALLALLKEKPFDQITIREITARAHTGYATFFRHYPTKEALLSDIASDEISVLINRTLPILHEADSYKSTLALCTYVSEHSRLWSALLTGGAAAIVRNEYIRLARGLAETEQNKQDWLPSDLGLIHGTGSIIDILAWWLAQGQAYSSEYVATILHRLVIGPLIGPLISKRIEKTVPAQ
jgi:AcrR family transcriptional regulator